MKDLRDKAMLNNFKKLNKIEIYSHIWIQNLYPLWCTNYHSMDKYQLIDAIKILHSI